jgi:hypothetical protein
VTVSFSRGNLLHGVSYVIVFSIVIYFTISVKKVSPYPISFYASYQYGPPISMQASISAGPSGFLTSGLEGFVCKISSKSNKGFWG